MSKQDSSREGKSQFKIFPFSNHPGTAAGDQLLPRIFSIRHLIFMWNRYSLLFSALMAALLVGCTKTYTIKVFPKGEVEVASVLNFEFEDSVAPPDSIGKSDTKMYIFERYWYDSSSYIEHLFHGFDSLLKVTTTDIYECCEEDISDLI